MTLRDRLTELVQACYTGLWIETHEPDEALSELAQLCQAEHWRYATWNIDAGLRIPGAESAAAGQDPLAAIRVLHGMADPQGTTLLVLQNLHRLLGSAEIVQALIQQIHREANDLGSVLAAVRAGPSAKAAC